MGAPGTVGSSGYVYPARVFVARRDNNGYAIGTKTDPNNFTASEDDTVYPAYLIPWTVDVTFEEDIQPLIRFQGAQQERASTYLPTITLGSFTLNLSLMDEQFNSLIESTTVDTTTISTSTVSAPNPGILGRPKFLIGINISVTNPDTGVDEWVTLAFLNTTIKRQQEPAVALQTGDATNPSNVSYQVTPSLSTRNVDGQLISDWGLGVEGNQVHYVRFRSAFPLYLDTYIADGTETTFNLTYLPVSDSATGSAQNSVTINGTQSSVTSVNTSTALVTLSAAGSANDIVQVFYQTEYVASA